LYSNIAKQEKYQNKIHILSLFLFPKGFLAASPDGLVGRDGLVEVKCPLRCAEISVADLARQDSSFCLQVE
jgi:hypothetical protein